MIDVANSEINIPLTAGVIFSLAGWLFSLLIAIVLWFVKRTINTIERRYELLQNKVESNWNVYVDKHALLVGRFDVLKENYDSNISVIRDDVREMKGMANLIPVMDTRLKQLETWIRNGDGGGKRNG